jgi:hypothetical protein
MYKLTEKAMRELKSDAYHSLLSAIERLNDNDDVSVEDIADASQAWQEFIDFCKPNKPTEAVSEVPEEFELTERTLAAREAIEKMENEMLEGICHEAIARACQYEAILTTKKDAVSDDERETLEELIDYVWKTYGNYYHAVKKPKYINHIFDVDYDTAPKVARALDSITDAYDESEDPDEVNERARENCPYYDSEDDFDRYRELYYS